MKSQATRSGREWWNEPYYRDRAALNEKRRRQYREKRRQVVGQTTLEGTLSELRIQTTIAEQSDQQKVGWTEWLKLMRGLLSLVEYHTTQTGTGVPTAPPQISQQDIRCSAEGCEVSWQVRDACLLQIEGKWYCREHQPKRAGGAVQPVGWVPDEKGRSAIELGRKAVLSKLSEEERRLINSHI